MNKYQEALDELKSWATTSSIPIGADKHFLYEQSHKIQELVDIYPEYLALKERATPKKVIFTNVDITTHADEFRIIKRWENCPICQSNVIGKYCPNCGQFLDWSKEQ